MQAYLLGTQAFADAVRNDNTTAVYRWVDEKNLDLEEVSVSAVSFMVLKGTIESLDAGRREIWRTLFERAAKSFERSGRVKPVSLRIATRAAELSASFGTGGGAQGPAVGELGLLVLATALDEELTLVDKRQPYHDDLEQVQHLSFVDPYE